MNNTPAQAREIVAQALESGEYTQGFGCLERGGTNCCLGVATREFMKHEQHSITTSRALEAGTDISFNDHVTILPKEVQSWLGFSGFLGNHSYGSLSGSNDNKSPFSEIAELFLNPPEGLLAQ